MKAVGIALGLGLLLSHLFALLWAEKVQEFLKGFPRNKNIGIGLLIVDAAFAWMLLREIDMGEFYKWRGRLLVAVPVFAFLIVRYCDEFLSVRALGTLLLLMAGPVLEAAFLQPQASRLLLPILSYAWVLIGMFWVGMPYLLRDQVSWLSDPEAKGRWKAACSAGMAYGAALLVLGFVSY